MQELRVVDTVYFRGSPIRVVNSFGERWFVARDICMLLGTTTTRLGEVLSDCEFYCAPVGLGSGRSKPLTIMSLVGLRRWSNSCRNRWSRELIAQLEACVSERAANAPHLESCDDSRCGAVVLNAERIDRLISYLELRLIDANLPAGERATVQHILAVAQGIAA